MKSSGLPRDGDGKLAKGAIDAIAVTVGPGLELCLKVSIGCVIVFIFGTL
jgi:hypothetical protein